MVVWNLQKANIWKPELVMMSSNRAIISGEWSRDGRKFCLGAASHKAFIGYFESLNNWWFCNKITGIFYIF